MGTILLLNNDFELAEKVRQIAVGWSVEFGNEFTAPVDGGPTVVATAGYGRTIGKIIEESPNLRWVQTWSAGVDMVPLDVLAAKGVFLTNASGVHPKPISESIFGYLLSLARGIIPAHSAQSEGRWTPESAGLWEIHGQTLGILGAGAIGSETAKIAQAFGMRVVGFARTDGVREHFDEIYTSLEPVLRNSDCVVNILPLTKATRHLMGAAEFAQMKRSAVYITVGRGPTTDYDALRAALENGVIAAAAADVTEPEPLPRNHPLFSVPNLLITPHIAGATQFYQERASEIFLENLRAFVETGAPVRNVVNLSEGY